MALPWPVGVLVSVGVLVKVGVVVRVGVAVGTGVSVGTSVGTFVAVAVPAGVGVLVAVAVATGAVVGVSVGVLVSVDALMVKLALEMLKKILLAQATCTRAVVVAILGAVTLAEPLFGTPVAKVVG